MEVRRRIKELGGFIRIWVNRVRKVKSLQRKTRKQIKTDPATRRIVFDQFLISTAEEIKALLTKIN